MNYKGVFKEKLSKLLFLEVDWEKFKRSTNIPQMVQIKNRDVFLPISSKYVTNNVDDQIKINNLPIYYFIEGMLIALGADENLKYVHDYIIILNNIKASEECAKSLIADRIKNNDLAEAYLLIKGLNLFTGDEDYYKKLLLIGESIAEKDEGFNEILLNDIEVGKKEYVDMPEPYLYNALSLKRKGDYQASKVEINEYIRRGGEVTSEIQTIVTDIENVSMYEKAIENLDKEPEKSIGTFLSLLSTFDKNPLIYFYLGVAYRKLGNHEKAIYYLNESISIESGILEVVNELGLNYACLGLYEQALKYFKKCFEATRDVELCTNIIMCYINLGDKEQAKLHLEIAKKIDSTDQIVCDLARMLEVR